MTGAERLTFLLDLLGVSRRRGRTRSGRAGASRSEADQGGAAGFWRRPVVPAGAAGSGERQFRLALAGRLEADGFEVVHGDEVIWRNDIAVRNGRRLAAEDVDAVIFNFSVWAWPQYARVAAQFCPQPIAMFSNVNPQYPGLVGMLANAGSLDQAGIRFTKSFGDVADDPRLRRSAVAGPRGRGGAAAARADLLPDRRPLARHRHDGDRSGAVDGGVRHRRGPRRSDRAGPPRRGEDGQRPAPRRRRSRTWSARSGEFTGRRRTRRSA